jgi:hypothetical protein
MVLIDSCTNGLERRLRLLGGGTIPKAGKDAQPDHTRLQRPAVGRDGDLEVEVLSDHESGESGFGDTDNPEGFAIEAEGALEDVRIPSFSSSWSRRRPTAGRTPRVR